MTTSHPPLTVAVPEKGNGAPGRDFLTWEERYTLQQAAKALLRQLGVTDLGPWR